MPRGHVPLVDMAATIYHRLGVAPDTVLRDAQNRPHRLIIGKPIQGILAG